MDWRLIVVALFGGGTVLAYGRVLVIRRRANLLHHDRRSRRDYLSAFGLFLTALLAAVAVTLLLFGQTEVGPPSVAAGLAFGAFLAVGILMATEKAER